MMIQSAQVVSSSSQEIHFSLIFLNYLSFPKLCIHLGHFKKGRLRRTFEEKIHSQQFLEKSTPKRKTNSKFCFKFEKFISDQIKSTIEYKFTMNES